ncbi:hypothetical protein HK100_009395 [Physocladia obscura]|uniref:Shikimate kinase n=1 Tax=Physocladia obscura TaxID=109957 RepID=A0AAD5T9C2_9FUNG|nr:hypothetical protein HK100_009395 [Physocladia obscura]
MSYPRTLVYLNGWPGSGKQTIAHELKELLGMRLVLDNHKIIDLAVTVAGRQGTPEYAAGRALIFEATVGAAAASSANERGFIMTGAHAGPPFDTGVFALAMSAVQRYAAPPLRVIGVTLILNEEENLRRLAGPNRETKLKSPNVLKDFRTRNLLSGLPNELVLDVSALSPREAAQRIADYVLTLDVSPSDAVDA